MIAGTPSDAQLAAEQVWGTATGDALNPAVHALELAMWQAQTRYDANFQARHFADDFVEFGRSGRVYDRKTIVMTHGPAIDARLMAMRHHRLAPGVLLATYDSCVRQADGQLWHAHRSSIWCLRNAAGQTVDDSATCPTPVIWQLRFHQATPFEPDGELAHSRP